MKTETKSTDQNFTLEKGFWKNRHDINAGAALMYQWDMYEKRGTIDNFRIAAGIKKGLRSGFFYTDSDLHKWADAASRVLSLGNYPELKKRIDEYISIMEKAQDDDGYLHTFNQLHFPGVRWKNFQIEHELYCMGHFIEAGIEHYLATCSDRLILLSEKTASLICSHFKNSTPRETPGHQEIELALIRLYRVRGNKLHLDMAQRFLDKRGRMILPGLNFLKDLFSHLSRMKKVKKQLGEKSSEAGFNIYENFQKKEPRLISLRLAFAILTGRFQQQHKPVLKQEKPTGHSVRWAYQSAALSMLYNEKKDSSIPEFQELLWNRLVERYMYVTGGIGSLPVVEGFGRAWELDNSFAYCETCAAIGSIFWNHEMLKATSKARYADMIEWQLYNAASAGIALDGKSYFYRNPLQSDGSLQRHSWFGTACCPSNISRLWSRLPSYLTRSSGNDVWIDQHVSSKISLKRPLVDIEIKSEFPWKGESLISVYNRSSKNINLHIRIPWWAGESSVKTGNNNISRINNLPGSRIFGPGLFDNSSYHDAVIPAKSKEKILCRFDMPVLELESHPKVKSNRGMRTVTKGPVVYCLESAGNSVSNFSLSPGTENFEFSKNLLGGTGIITAKSSEGENFSLIPYYAWGNRGPSSMKVWLKTSGNQNEK